ncbi:Bro-N domain-containing protein [Nostoc sp. TCL240-02]|uniref:BRO-N domain-containing protein n=1 Tax=Nostoc sp. TCL240-02 TaxID=2572090 RepID=UPI00157F8877|nr:Bro-N domain-containing protein [Nostoc sp. TCL240-02]QKQ75610.1 phage antirepressor [Nostoc sp. TCL240-02]
MSNLTVFQFESHEVRFVGTAFDPWWVAADVCAVLEIKNSRDAIARLDEDEKDDVAITDTIGRQQMMTAINESGLYSLILTSRKAQAKRFKKWVTSEVLPSIRKTGKYELPQAEQPPALPNPTAQEISDLFDLTLGGAGLDSKLIAGVKLNAIASYNPALLEAAEIAKSALAIPVDETLVRPTQLGEKLSAKTGQKWSAIKVNKLLMDLGFQIPNPDGKNPAYLPTEKGKDYSQLVLDTAKGRDKTVQSLQWHLSVLEAIELEG